MEEKMYRSFTCDLQSKPEGKCLFAKYILRRTDAELATSEGETVSEWVTKVGNSSELIFCGGIGI